MAKAPPPKGIGEVTTFIFFMFPFGCGESPPAERHWRGPSFHLGHKFYAVAKAPPPKGIGELVVRPHRNAELRGESPPAERHWRAQPQVHFIGGEGVAKAPPPKGIGEAKLMPLASTTAVVAKAPPPKGIGERGYLEQ